MLFLSYEMQGGELVFRHTSRDKIFDLAKNNKTHTYYIAFYADCEHEIRPVTSGHRLALVYNLILSDARELVAPGDQAATFMKEAIQNWEQVEYSVDKLVYMLDHRYTEEGLRKMSQLKGADRAVASLLEELQKQGVIEGGLAFIKYTESGEMGKLYITILFLNANFVADGNSGWLLPINKIYISKLY